MIRIQQIKLRPEQDCKLLQKKAARILKIEESAISDFHVVRRSLDARKKPELFYSYVVDVEVSEQQRILAKCKDANVSETPEETYHFPEGDKKPLNRPVIAGMGPAGLFCGYFLAKAGFQPVILERGKDVDARLQDVERFWETGALLPNSNVQFGEGGAGTFSDGKLNTLVKDKCGRNKEVLRLFVEFGAPEEILYDSKPHVGTDVLRGIVKNMREAILSLGGEVHFESMLTEICTDENGVCGVVVNGKETISTNHLILAIGHSARNTFEMLYQKKIPMEAKSFAVGLRVEHPQSMINFSQYGAETVEHLPAAAYKLTGKAKDDRGVYSFCMCPGGYVVNASSEEGRLCVNGMSYSGRDGSNANSAIVVAVNPEDFGSDSPLAGVEFQRELEERAYKSGRGKVPVQTYGDFKQAVQGGATPPEDSIAFSADEDFSPAIKGEFAYCDLTQILPPYVSGGIVEGMEQFGRKIKGFNRADALLSGVESRTSSPLRILRDDSLQSCVRGLFPCGEGAGYAGGITSAAMDGIRVAEAVVCAVNGYQKGIDEGNKLQ